jgi:crotonobetainyl-CoA:carnitine CoA-transferase CaiB-like acyl-CoA transferase
MINENKSMLNRPLAHLKVLDFSTLLPGPYASMQLADMGAEVLRIDSINRRDLVKELKPSKNNSSYAYLTLNRNKQAMGLDLKSPEAISIVKKLIATYDVIIEQFRPEVMTKLGLGYKTLKKINPQIIYCSITGYGQNGVYKNRPGHDINYLALSGLASFSGTSETGPVLSGTQIADIAGGSHHAIIGILAAVIQRGITGLGQHIDISMTDAAFALNGLFGAGAVGADDTPKLGETLLNGGSFYGYYQTKDKRYLSVGSLEPKFARLFFINIGQEQWLKRVESPDKQEQHRLKQDISRIIAQKTLEQWQVLFDPLDACIEPVLTVSEAAKSSLMIERNMIVDVHLCSGDKISQIAPAIKFNRFSQDANPDKFYVVEPCLASTTKILSSIGYEKKQISMFSSRKTIA